MSKHYLRPLKYEYFDRFSQSIECRRNLSIATCRGVMLTPRGQLLRPFPEDGAKLLVEDNDFCISLNPIADSSVSYDGGVDRIVGKTLYGGYLRKIWGHFLLGSIGRLWPLADTDFLKDIDNIVFFCDEGAESTFESGNYRNLLDLFIHQCDGNFKGRLIFLNRPVSVDHLLIPDLCYEHDVFYSSEGSGLIKVLRERALEGHTLRSRKRRIFFTRSAIPGGCRNEINMDCLDSLFARNGFEIISPEKFSLDELIRMMAECECIASVSGSTAHNLMFAPPGGECRCVILDRHSHVNKFQVSLGLMAGLDNCYVDASRMVRFSTSEGFVSLYGMTPMLQQFCKDNDLEWEGIFPEGRRALARELRRYLRRYRRYYGESEALQAWEVESGKCVSESLLESRQFYSRWLEEHKALTWYDWLSPRVVFRTLFR